MPTGLKYPLKDAMKNIFDRCVVLAVFTVISTRPAYAYLDPGSASLIIRA
jgi:hypothetical protein